MFVSELITVRSSVHYERKNYFYYAKSTRALLVMGNDAKKWTKFCHSSLIEIACRLMEKELPLYSMLRLASNSFFNRACKKGTLKQSFTIVNWYYRGNKKGINVIH